MTVMLAPVGAGPKTTTAAGPGLEHPRRVRRLRDPQAKHPAEPQAELPRVHQAAIVQKNGGR